MRFKPSRLGPSQPLRTNLRGPSKCAEHGAHQHGFGSTVSVLLPWIRGSISDTSPSAVHCFVHSSHRFPEETLCFPASARALVGSIYHLPPRVLQGLTDPSGRTPSRAVVLRNNHGRALQEQSHFHSQNFCCPFLWTRSLGSEMKTSSSRLVLEEDEKRLDICLMRPLLLVRRLLLSDASSTGVCKVLEEEQDTVRLVKSSTESKDLEKNQRLCCFCWPERIKSPSSTMEDVLLTFLCLSLEAELSLTLWVLLPRCLRAGDKGGLGFQGMKMSCFSNLRLFCSMAQT